MNTLEEQYALFQRVLAETPKHVLDQIAAEIDAMDIGGPSPEEFFSQFDNIEFQSEIFALESQDYHLQYTNELVTKFNDSRVGYMCYAREEDFTIRFDVDVVVPVNYILPKIDSPSASNYSVIEAATYMPFYKNCKLDSKRFFKYYQEIATESLYGQAA